MFKREHHLRIATILQSLNSEILHEHQCLFGGGTAIALLKDEYRESVDIDFLCSDQASYRNIRSLVREGGISALSREQTSLEVVRDFRIDQYGIRNRIKSGNTEIKFEIIFEARINLESSSRTQQICGVPSLSLIDMAATKLLANSDRWADAAVYSRDLIDLAMLDLDSSSFDKAIKKAEAAYGESVQKDLNKAITRLRDYPSRLEECMDALKISDLPQALLWKKIRKLSKK